MVYEAHRAEKIRDFKQKAFHFDKTDTYVPDEYYFQPPFNEFSGGGVSIQACSPGPA